MPETGPLPTCAKGAVHRPLSCSGSAAGFSLVELIVTLVLIGILSVTAGPAFFSVSQFAVSTGAGDFLAMARFAQRQAMSRGAAVRVQLLLDHGAGEIRVESGPPPASCVRTDASRTLASISVLRTVRMNDDLVYPFGPLGILQFDPQGALQSAAPVACPSALAADLDADGAVELCIEPSGFAHAGACY